MKTRTFLGFKYKKSTSLAKLEKAPFQNAILQIPAHVIFFYRKAEQFEKFYNFSSLDEGYFSEISSNNVDWFSCEKIECEWRFLNVNIEIEVVFEFSQPTKLG